VVLFIKIGLERKNWRGGFSYLLTNQGALSKSEIKHFLSSSSEIRAPASCAFSNHFAYSFLFPVAAFARANAS
jgi:hypothetical protein